MDRQGTRKWLLSKMFPKKYGDKIVETSVLPVLKKAQADQSTFEAVTSLVSPGAANIERAGFAV